MKSPIVPRKAYTAKKLDSRDYVSDSMGLDAVSFMQLAPKAATLREITRNDSHWAIQVHSRSEILVRIESLYTTSYYWILLTFTYPILHCFRATAAYWSSNHYLTPLYGVNPITLCCTYQKTEIEACLCCGYMWNKITSKLFQPSSMSDWNKFAWKLFQIYFSSWLQLVNIFQHVRCRRNNFISQFPTWLRAK